MSRAHSQPRSCAIRAASLRVVAPVLPIAADRWLRTVPSERCTRAAIAARVHLSEGTVRNHLSAAIGKTGATTRSEAARIAQDRGWL